jgi:hypothetical protein
VGRSGCGYRAFISYSHADRRVVEWLHAALEAHRVPAKLVGELTPLGPVPDRRLFTGGRVIQLGEQGGAAVPAAARQEGR